MDREGLALEVDENDGGDLNQERRAEGDARGEERKDDEVESDEALVLTHRDVGLP